MEAEIKQTHNCLLCQVTNIAAGSAANITSFFMKVKTLSLQAEAHTFCPFFFLSFFLSFCSGVNPMKEKCMHVATNPSKAE
jgi:hypothetical protein